MISKILEALFGGKRDASGDPGREMQRLARLLASEIRLYNEEALSPIGPGEALPDPIRAELARAYDTYSKAVGASEDALAVFCTETSRILTRGDEDAVRTAIAER